MKTRVYLLMTVILGILSFGLSEAKIVDPSAGETVGPPSWSVTIPVKKNLNIAKKVEEANSALGSVSTTQGRIPKSTGESTGESSKLRKQDKSQSGEQGQIFDRWGNSKNKGSR